MSGDVLKLPELAIFGYNLAIFSGMGPFFQTKLLHCVVK